MPRRAGAYRPKGMESNDMATYCHRLRDNMLDAVTSARAGFGIAGLHQGKCLIGTVGRSRGSTRTLGRRSDTRYGVTWAERVAPLLSILKSKWLWGNPPTLT